MGLGRRSPSRGIRDHTTHYLWRYIWRYLAVVKSRKPLRRNGFQPQFEDWYRDRSPSRGIRHPGAHSNVLARRRARPAVRPARHHTCARSLAASHTRSAVLCLCAWTLGRTLGRSCAAAHARSADRAHPICEDHIDSWPRRRRFLPNYLIYFMGVGYNGPSLTGELPCHIVSTAPDFFQN